MGIARSKLADTNKGSPEYGDIRPRKSPEKVPEKEEDKESNAPGNGRQKSVSFTHDNVRNKSPDTITQSSGNEESKTERKGIIKYSIDNLEKPEIPDEPSPSVSERGSRTKNVSFSGGLNTFPIEKHESLEELFVQESRDDSDKNVNSDQQSINPLYRTRLQSSTDKPLEPKTSVLDLRTSSIMSDVTQVNLKPRSVSQGQLSTVTPSNVQNVPPPRKYVITEYYEYIYNDGNDVVVPSLDELRKLPNISNNGKGPDFLPGSNENSKFPNDITDGFTSQREARQCKPVEVIRVDGFVSQKALPFNDPNIIMNENCYDFNEIPPSTSLNCAAPQSSTVTPAQSCCLVKPNMSEAVNYKCCSNPGYMVSPVKNCGSYRCLAGGKPYYQGAGPSNDRIKPVGLDKYDMSLSNTGNTRTVIFENDKIKGRQVYKIQAMESANPVRPQATSRTNPRRRGTRGTRKSNRGRSRGRV